MQTITYKNPEHKKEAWGNGPWQDEPDKKQWLDKETGLPCLIVRNQLGALCGYVGVPANHPAYKLHYDGITLENAAAMTASFRKNSKKITDAKLAGKSTNAVISEIADEPFSEREVVPGIGQVINDLRVHGGLTFSGECQERANECEGICHKPSPGESDEIWWYGFDCNHYRDFAPAMAATLKEAKLEPWDNEDQYRDLSYVTRQVRKLARQLKKRRVKKLAKRYLEAA